MSHNNYVNRYIKWKKKLIFINIFLDKWRIVAIDCIQNHIFLANISIKSTRISSKP